MGPTGLFIGRATMDVIGLVDRFPAADDKVSTREMLAVAGGPALNAAITFAHLGGRATLVSSFGSGLFASAALQECRRYGVVTVDLAAGRPHAFPVSVVVSAREGASRCILNSPDAPVSTKPPEALDLPAAPDIVLLDQFEVIAANVLVPPLRAAGVPVVLDGGSWKEVSTTFLHLATMPIVSSRFHPSGHPTIEATVGYFEGGAFSRWAITRGALGMMYGEDEKTRPIEAIAVDAIDTSAAGDVFHGAFCFAHATGHPFADALRYAARVAARSCRFVGPRAWMHANSDT